VNCTIVPNFVEIVQTAAEAILTPNELVLTFVGLHVCVQFGENRQRNATVEVSTDGQTHTRTHAQTRNDFIICPMLYAIAMGQITTN